jgi:PIF1-like helicase
LQKKKEEIVTAREHQAEKERKSKSTLPIYNVDEVKVIDKAFLQKRFKAESKSDRKYIDNTVSDFSINEEQERAFRIVANHSVDPTSEQLIMYLGGMAGTGKSQVIKALISFFERKNQPHLFLIMAPTGSAAALVDGSTYHSILGINGSYASESLATLGNIRARIKQVEYVFLDEISMVDCGSLHTISAQMCMALKIDHKAFGGKNVIFAGDFAQLPPPGVNPPLYSHNVSTVLHNSYSPTLQKMDSGQSTLAPGYCSCDSKTEYEAEKSVCR